MLKPAACFRAAAVRARPRLFLRPCCSTASNWAHRQITLQRQRQVTGPCAPFDTLVFYATWIYSCTLNPARSPIIYSFRWKDERPPLSYKQSTAKFFESTKRYFINTAENGNLCWIKIVAITSKLDLSSTGYELLIKYFSPMVLSSDGTKSVHHFSYTFFLFVIKMFLLLRYDGNYCKALKPKKYGYLVHCSKEINPRAVRYWRIKTLTKQPLGC